MACLRAHDVPTVGDDEGRLGCFINRAFASYAFFTKGIRPMPRWEYRAIHLNEIPAGEEDIDVLNDAGKEGWELVGVTTSNIAYLKRQVVSSTRPIARNGSNGE
jgi:hypothetical protein